MIMLYLKQIIKSNKSREKMKTTIALVVLCLIQGSLANDRLGPNDQKYYKDSISPGIDPSSYSSSQIDYSDLPPSLDPTSNSHSLPYPKTSNDFPSLLAPAQHDYSHSDSNSIESFAFVNSDYDSPLSQHSPQLRFGRNGKLIVLGSLILNSIPANDQLTDYLKHTTIVAHLVNGIAIQNGLMNGNMTSNDVAAELLNFGSISISTIANFKKDSIVAVTGQLKKPQPILDSSITEMEELALKWERLISKSSDLENATSLPGNDKYFNEVEKFKKEFETTVVSLPTFNVVDSDFTGIKARLDDNAKYDEIYNSFATFSRDFTKKLEDFDKYRKDIEDFTKYPLLQEGPSIFKPLERLIHLTDTRLTFNTELTDESKLAISKSVEDILSFATISRAAEKEFSNIHKLADYRSSPLLTNRKNTIGFPGGINDINQLVKDIGDPWIGKMVNVQGSNMNDLTDGLEPLFNFQKTLSGVDEKLKPISLADTRDALSHFAQIQKELSSLTPDSAKSVSTMFDSLKGCTLQPIGTNVYKNSKTLTEKIKILGSVYDSAKLALAAFDSKTVKGEMDQLISSLGFKDLGKNTSPEAEVKEAVKRLEKHNTLDDIKKLVDQVKEKFAGIPVTSLKEITQYIIENKKDITFPKIHGESQLFDCTSKLAVVSAKASQGIKAVRSLRVLEVGKIAKVESVATSVLEAASGLSGVASIQDKMKKDAKEAAVELNKLPDASNKSVVIGQSVDSLNTAVKLRDLESQIGQLKSIDALVQTEIQKVLNPSDRSMIMKQWGNHKKDMDQLEKVLAGIQSFDSKLNVSNATTLGDYGKPLANLALLTTVSMNAKEKLKALETLALTADSKNKPVIENCQKTLEQLANLDLGFASHTAQYKSAPPAFQALHDFLSKFLAVPHNTNQQEQQQSSNKEDSGSTSIWYFIGGGAGVVTLIAIVAASVYFFLKHKREKEQATDWKKTVMNWVDEHKLQDTTHAFQMHNTVISAVNIGVISTYEGYEANQLLPNNKHRNPDILCNPKAMLVLDKGRYIHASQFGSDDQEVVQFVGTQAPMISRTYLREIYDKALHEVAKLETRVESDTREDFWLMVMTKGTEYAVSLLTDKEMKALACHYYPDTTKTPLACGRFTVKMESESLILNKTVKQRNLAIEDTQNKLEARKLEHLQFLNWDAEQIPESHETALAVMARVKGSKKPVVVHCSDGTERTLSFIGLQHIYEAVKKHPHRKFQDIVVEMCKRRWHGMQRNVWSAWLVSGVRKQLIMENKMNNDDYIEDLPVLKAMQTKVREDATLLHNALRDNIDAWINKNYSVNGKDQYNLHAKIMDLMRAVAKPDVDDALKHLPPSKHRYKDIYCNPKTAVKLKFEGKEIKIHANTVKSRAKYATEFIATQGPTTKAGEIGDTREDFWMMVILKNADFIVNLVNESEMGKKCAYYFKLEDKQSIDCGRFKITTISSKQICSEEVTERVLQVVDNATEKKFDTKLVTQYHFHSWKDQDIPDGGHEAPIKVMEMVNKSEHPVIVHCSAGVGRTVAFIGLQYVYEEILMHPDTTIHEVMGFMRNQRWHGIQKVPQSYWLYLGVVLRFIKKFKLEMKIYTDQFDNVLPIVEELAGKKKKIKKDEKVKKEKKKAEKAAAKEKEGERKSAAGGVSEFESEGEVDTDVEALEESAPEARGEQRQPADGESSTESSESCCVVIPNSEVEEEVETAREAPREPRHGQVAIDVENDGVAPGEQRQEYLAIDIPEVAED
ncbi:hypothetical protein CRE_12367 [Caenorhabditis remanei]|uniref:Protein-tyrosine-phosphatase n=1 Tax=Caenorhabditis remanei TaxID=31234 RepID=E3NMK5_CAERE|nr:hypothetical protein CRE_12367 [Caenorhabditis remanei]